MKNKKSIIAWCFYDWANSSFFTVVLTFVFATYFTETIAPDPIIGTSMWGNMIAISGLIIAFLSPILGAISDHEGRRKRWIFLFTALAVVASALLWFAQPQPDYLYFTLICVALGLIGVEVAVVFYNAMLKDLVPENYIGRISGWAWGFGYAGGLVCLIISLFIFIEGDISWLNLEEETLEQIRICGPFVALWLALFSLPLFIFTPDQKPKRIHFKTATVKGLQTLWQTLRSLRQHKEIVKFLLARMLYIDGLNTVFAFGGIYAAGTFGMSLKEVIEFGIAMNVAAGLGAASFAWLDDYLGAKPTILIALFFMILSGTGMLLATTTTLFWILGMSLSVCIGPVQAASRSLMAKVAPAQLITEMFGLYALSGKVTAFMGPWLLAWVTLHFNSQRLGMSTVLLFLVSGFILLLFVKPKVQ
ncbi:MAG: MFS transporter [Gammaproteobacteria bacterium]